jgi:threonylcarbamoyladenosine tRNA methylthiotransferase MtaB
MAFIKANQGRPLKAVVQNRTNVRTGRLTAVTSNYLNIHLKKDSTLKGKLVDVVFNRWDSNLNISGEIYHGKSL